MNKSSFDIHALQYKGDHLFISCSSLESREKIEELLLLNEIKISIENMSSDSNTDSDCESDLESEIMQLNENSLDIKIHLKDAEVALRVLKEKEFIDKKTYDASFVSRFSYKQISNVFSTQPNKLERNDQYCQSQSFKNYRPFIGFTTNPKKSMNSKSDDTGWKIHIALDDSNKENLGRGWDSIVDIFIKYQLDSLKVVKPGTNFSETNRKQSGKQITIYINSKKEMDKPWPEILNEITEALVKNNIKPAPFSPMDQRINNSEYITYRYALNENGDYKPSHISTLNKTNTPTDPFKDIEIHVKNQLRNPARDEVFLTDFAEEQDYEHAINEKQRQSRSPVSSTIAYLIEREMFNKLFVSSKNIKLNEPEKSTDSQSCEDQVKLKL